MDGIKTVPTSVKKSDATYKKLIEIQKAMCLGNTKNTRLVLVAHFEFWTLRLLWSKLLGLILPSNAIAEGEKT